MISKKENIYNPAYVVCPPIIKPNYRPKSKHVQLAFILEIVSKSKMIDKLITEIDSTNSSNESLKVLKKIPGVKDFLAYELWTDLTYFNFFKQGWSNNDFVKVEPGARWGLNILMGRDTKCYLLPEEDYFNLIICIRDSMPEALEKLGLIKEWLKISYRKAYFTFKTSKKGKLITFSYCNIHELWSSEENLEI